MLAKIVIDKIRHHLPEYRQVKQYADMGFKLPTSTINDWVHAVAAKLDPLYEAQRKESLSSDYLQIDEVPWNIIDKPDSARGRPGNLWTAGPTAADCISCISMARGRVRYRGRNSATSKEPSTTPYSTPFSKVAT